MIIEVWVLLSVYSVRRFCNSNKKKHTRGSLKRESQRRVAGNDSACSQVPVSLGYDIEPEEKSPKGFSIAKDEHEINRNLKISAVTLGLAAIRQFVYAPIAPVYLGVFAYQNCAFFDRTVTRLIKEKKIGYDANVLVIQTLGVGFNQHFMVSLAVFVYFISEKVISLTESQSQKLVANSFKGLKESVWCLKDGAEIQIKLNEVQVGHLVIVGAGEVIPVDGSIWSGSGLLDQHTLTGESQLAEKEAGDFVFATTVLMSGAIVIKTEKTGEDTTAAKIDEILNHSVDYKSAIQQKGEQWADLGVLPFFGLAAFAAATSGVSSALGILTAHFGSRIRILAPLGTLRFLKKASNQTKVFWLKVG